MKKLDISDCYSLRDLGFIKNLKNLEYLDISNCPNLKSIEVTASPEKLNFLDASSCLKLDNLNLIANFKNLFFLSFHGSNTNTVEFLNNLKELNELKIVDLNINDYSPIQLSNRIYSLTIGYSNIVNLSFASNCTNIRYLYIYKCDEFNDLSALNGKNVSVIKISSCKSLKSIFGLSGLLSLTNLFLDNCDLLSSISALSTNRSLQKISFTSRRIQSIEPLRSIPTLRELKEFDPPQVAECLAHSAVLRSDWEFIADHAETWLKEASEWTEGTPVLRDRFAATLGEAFSLLGEHPIENPYEEFLRAHPEFTSAPWKAWLGGTMKQSGVELMRRRIERQEIATATPGCLGGICLVLPDEEWSRQWLSELEKERSANAKELLPVAPEICLAYARLGEMEALGRWLERLTDPSDPGALDDLQASLAKWRLSSGDLQKARSHISAIHSPTARDPILSELVMAELDIDPDTASEDLLMIQGSETRGYLAKKLATEPAFTSSEPRLHRLLVAAGENPTALAELIILLGASVPSEIVNRLSAQLGLPQAELQQWRITQLESLLKQLQTIARI